MNYQKTQIYLDPAVHSRLVREAADKGISLAELIRQVTARHVGESATPYGEKNFDAIFDLGDAGEATDAAKDFDRLMGEALDDLYDKKMGRSRSHGSRKRSAGRRPGQA